ncbi:hypothetical protein J6590_086636 [Homalodisca vitripennis]|nr:hypothetical protein J6590_086636 [Homalodisca vitripennis]
MLFPLTDITSITSSVCHSETIMWSTEVTVTLITGRPVTCCSLLLQILPVLPVRETMMWSTLLAVSLGMLVFEITPSSQLPTYFDNRLSVQIPEVHENESRVADHVTVIYTLLLKGDFASRFFNYRDLTTALASSVEGYLS